MRAVVNTPRTPKPPTRYKVRTRTSPQLGGTFGITDPVYAAEMGFIVTYWTHVEDYMMNVLFLQLMSGGSFPGDSHQPLAWSSRQIFRSVISQKARITIMRELLHKAPFNTHLSQKYDDLIDEFSSINGTRNDYVHGMWMVESETNRLLFWYTEAEIMSNIEPRPVTITELQGVSARMRAFMHSLMVHKPEPPSP